MNDFLTAFSWWLGVFAAIAAGLAVSNQDYGWATFLALLAIGLFVAPTEIL